MITGVVANVIGKVIGGVEAGVIVEAMGGDDGACFVMLILAATPHLPVKVVGAEVPCISWNAVIAEAGADLPVVSGAEMDVDLLMLAAAELTRNRVYPYKVNIGKST